MLAPLAVLTACGGDDDEPSGSPTEVLTAARTALDETPGVVIDLRTRGELPKGTDGVLAASGTLTRQPAFEGTITAVLSGFSADVPVVVVDGDMYADIPLLPGGMVKIDPDDYGVPDPTALINTETGVSTWLTAVEDPEQSGTMRDGSRVLTTYGGSLPGSAVTPVLPTADEGGAFVAKFSIDADGLLRVAEVTGPIYAGKDDVTYVVTFAEYGVDKQIVAP